MFPGVLLCVGKHKRLFPPVCNLLFSFSTGVLYNIITYGYYDAGSARYGGNGMTRTAAREIAVHFAFELGFTGQTADELLEEALNRKTFAQIGEEEPLYTEFPNETQREYIVKLVKGVYEHSPELDEYISKYAIGWKFSRLNRVAIAIMRVAMYEILYMQDIPNAAAINEAVEMTKHYEEPEVVSFVNGILGSFVRNECPPDPVSLPRQGEPEA